MIRQLGILSLFLVLAHGKPVTYDQRQDGGLNFHAKLDNIMIVIATPGEKGPSSLFSDLASQILELRGLTSRNRKITVADEEIVEQGKNPLSVKILRIEGEGTEENEGQGRGSSIQVGESQGEEVEENQDKALGPQKTENIKVILDIKDTDIKGKKLEKEAVPTITEKKEIPSENEKVLGNLHISKKIELIIPKEVEKQESINLEYKPTKTESHEKDLSTIQDPVKLEKIPEKSISFGTTVSVDETTQKVIYILKKKNQEDKPGDSKLEKIGDQEKIFLEKSIPQESGKKEIIKSEIKGSEISETQEKISTVIQEKQVLPKSLENQEIIKQEEKSPEKIKAQEQILSDREIIQTKIEKKEEILEKSSKTVENKINKEKKLAVTIEDKVVPKSRRVERELGVPLNDPTYLKNRMSLEKELPRIENVKEEEEEAGDKNEVRLIVDQMSQLKPIGDMIENCGPGRIRNRYGICQFNESFN